ncbi:MAG: 4Fe-4S cluster-binding domain-containing protein [Promethearchaeia archaeon]
MNGSFGSGGCIWCDSPDAQKSRGQECSYEPAAAPESQNDQKIERIKNPVTPKTLIPILQKLQTPDLHSVSCTGGEPLTQLPFLLDLAKTVNEHLDFPLYLETNGSILPNPKQIKKLGDLFSYCCCDIKDRSARAASEEKWQSLVETELSFINSMITQGVRTFAKIVVTQKTQLSDIGWICRNLAKIKYPTGKPVGFAIQPVHLPANQMRETYGLSKGHLFRIFQAAAQHLPPESLSLSVQAHKYLNLR